jgi:very-short-patch-repair endonuclease
VKHNLARHLRKNLTDAEKRLWWRLRYRQLQNCKFRRQAPVGDYVVDFVCFERNLIVELDGGGHTLKRRQDAERTKWLESQGFTVLRFWNSDVVKEMDGVLEAIWNALSRATPHPDPPPQGGREKVGAIAVHTITARTERHG